MAGIVLCLQGRQLEASATGEPASGVRLVSSEPLVVCGGETGVSGEAGESEEAGLCVENGLGASSSTPHWAWCLEPGLGIQLGLNLGSY